MAVKPDWEIVIAYIKKDETPGQVMARIMSGHGKVEDVAALVNFLGDTSSLRAIKKVAARHQLPGVNHLITEYEQLAARYWGPTR
ncbi:hypothetical protein GZL_06047 [Streptomyces sp. 769]|nr:hypothetical protein GZL_06047 [Streptomyces sp. 769]